MQTFELPPAWPSGAFSRISTFAPASAAVIAVAAPAPPKPTTTTSYSASHGCDNSKASATSSACAAEVPSADPANAAAASVPATNERRFISQFCAPIACPPIVRKPGSGPLGPSPPGVVATIVEGEQVGKTGCLRGPTDKWRRTRHIDGNTTRIMGRHSHLSGRMMPGSIFGPQRKAERGAQG